MQVGDKHALEKLSEYLPAHRILLILSIMLIVASIGELLGFAKDSEQLTFDERIEESIKLITTAFVLALLSILCRSRPQFRNYFAVAEFRLSLILSLLFVFSVSVQWKIGFNSSLESAMPLAIVLLFFQVLVILSVVSLVRNLRIGWYVSWCAILSLATMALVFSFSTFDGYGRVRNIAVAAAIFVSCFFIGLSLSDENLLERMSVHRFTKLTCLNLIFAIASGICLVIAYPLIGTTIVSVFLLMLAFNKKGQALYHRLVSPWIRPFRH